jgi:hypothetical protein
MHKKKAALGRLLKYKKVFPAIFMEESIASDEKYDKTASSTGRTGERPVHIRRGRGASAFRHIIKSPSLLTSK